MAVIINELEVVIESPESNRRDTSEGRPAEEQTIRLWPDDLADMAERQTRVMARVAAH